MTIRRYRIELEIPAECVESLDDDKVAARIEHALQLTGWPNYTPSSAIAVVEIQRLTNKL